MKLTSKQTLELFMIAADSLPIANGYFKLDREARLRLVNAIIGQQDNSLREPTKDLTTGKELE